MSKLLRLKVGTFLQIPLEDGSFGYGRVLARPYMAFYNHRTTEPLSNIDEIARQRVLFNQAVRLFDSDGWVTLGVRPLDGEVARPVVRFMQDLGDFRKCTIFDSTGMERSATPQECVGLERAAVWDAPNIAARLLDTFMGRPNDEEIRSRVLFEDF